MRRLCVMYALIASTRMAVAGGLVIGDSSPRSIGRAGTGTVGDDGGGALLVNPAAMARREGYRGQVGLAYIDDEIAWQSHDPNAPVARDQAPSSMAPMVAAIGPVGAWVVGIGAMTSAVSDRSVRRPRDVPPEDFGVSYDFRYAGIAGALRRDTVKLGAARRLGDSLAIGLAVGASRVTLTEVRRMWAGFSGRDTIGAPQQDVEIAFDGSDRFSLDAIAGVLVAPADSPLELGASLAWTQTSRIDADVTAVGTRPLGPSIASDGASATLDVKQPVVARAGARYLARRFVAELGGELAFASESAGTADWTIHGIRVVDRTGVDTVLAHLPSRVSLRTHGAVRGAFDAELIAGFLWATAGYAYTVGSVAASKQSLTFGDLGGHTVGLGLEGSAGGFTFTLGWSRTWAVKSAAASTLALDNPFLAGDRAVPAGNYDSSIDQIGIFLDAELDAPR